MKGFNLPRNMKIKKNEDGTFNIFTIKAKLTIPLKSFENRNILTSAMVSYLEDYKSRLNKDKEGKITDIKTLGRIDAILSKPRYDKDPVQIDAKVECRYTEAHYRRAGFKGYDDFKEKEAAEIKLRKEETEKKAKEVSKDAKAKQ